MAAKAKNRAKAKKRPTTRQGLNQIKRGVKTTASSVVDEIDNAKDVLLKDIQEALKIVRTRAKAARAAAKDATSSVKETVSEAQLEKLSTSWWTKSKTRPRASPTVSVRSSVSCGKPRPGNSRRR